MIRRLAITTAITAAAASALVVGGNAVPTSGAQPQVGLASTSTELSWAPNDRNHGPDWDGRRGNWDGRSRAGHGGGWDGNGGGWDGHRWWVSRQRCQAGHGHVAGWNDRRTGVYCRGGIFNGAPVHF